MMILTSLMGFLPNSTIVPVPSLTAPVLAKPMIQEEQSLFVQESLKSGAQLMIDGKYKEAILVLTRVTDTEITDRFDAVMRHRRLGEAYYRLGKHKESAEHYRKVLYQPTKNLLRITTIGGQIIEHKLTQSEIEKGSMDSDANVQAVQVEFLPDGGQKLDSGDPIELSRYAVSLYETGNIDEAIAIYNTAVPLLNFRDGKPRFKVLQLTEFNRGNSNQGRLLAAAHAALGVEALSNREKETAEIEFRLALKHSERNVWANYYLGRLLQKKGNDAEVEQLFARATRYGNRAVAEAIRDAASSDSNL